MFSLTTPRLLIRPYTADDIPHIVNATQESLATVGRWLSWCSQEYDAAKCTQWVMQSQRHIQAGTAFDFGIFNQTSGELVGAVSINNIQPIYQMGNIGYWVRQSAQRQGIAQEAAEIIIRFGFGQLGLTRLEIVAGEHNRPSRRIAEKVGARFEGIARNRLIVGGRPIDAAMYSLIPADIDNKD
ncbi:MULTISPECIES: GNAT family protein [unclassified Brenneria]|uniref:GNAT family N-acetyltransferase n=1 Tax=unclassified Brenneria TaxID=2634434 RepID=UPI0029C2B8AF|nr:MULTISPECIES: GNAT family protein [unclassified Brenneria]MDX5627012.1 GNAT family protein [Brenneria sp. L3-3Z]MDX5693638.1 GNAT family protein [Brenneria sp. L4-2C]